MALAAQGFADARPTGRIDRRHVRQVFDRVGLIQIDSVNVLVRSQELPLFARLGPHPRDLLPKMLDAGELFEYWAHEASLLPIETLPWFRWTMDAKFIRWAGLRRMAEEHPDVVERVHAVVTERGPIAPSDIAEREGRSGPWWGWDNTQRAFAVLFAYGAISARRRPNFEREYDLLHRMLPAEHVETPGLSEHEARRAMVLRAARSLGVGDRRRPVRLLPPQRPDDPAGDRRAGGRGAAAARARSRAGSSRRTCTPRRASRASVRRARCCRRSTR